MKRMQRLFEALYRVYEHSGFAMAGAVAFSFVVSLFPFCIFLGALSGVFGGRELAQDAITQLFAILPAPVAKGLAPEVEAIMGSRRIDLLTVSGFLALFFATSAIETLRAALNGAYRVHEKRPYPLCLLISMLFVFVSAISTLVLTWAVVVGPSVIGPAIAARFQTNWIKTLFDSSWLGPWVRYGLAGAVIAVQLFAFHLLTGGRPATARRCLAGDCALDRALADARQPLVALPRDHQLFALLCRPVAADDRADLLPIHRDHDSARRRIQSRHHGSEAHAARVCQEGSLWCHRAKLTDPGGPSTVRQIRKICHPGSHAAPMPELHAVADPRGYPGPSLAHCCGPWVPALRYASAGMTTIARAAFSDAVDPPR